MKLLAILTLILCSSSAALAESTLILEGGQVWQNRNDVHIPPNSGGTKFEIDEITGDGPASFFRAEYVYRFQSPHAIRLLYAPLTLELEGAPNSAIDFDGVTFAAGSKIDFTYTFNSYRATYFYALWGHGEKQFNVGFTAKQRDAEIKLKQGSTVSSYDNTGFVPLLYVEYQNAFSEKWFFNFTMDGLAGGPGRAFDVALKLRRALSESAQFGLGYRTIEGGADNDKVFTFSWFNYALADLTITF